MITRLRPLPEPNLFGQYYMRPHNHFDFGVGSIARVDATIELAQATLPLPVKSIADLTCGNGHIAKTLAGPETELHLGDFAPGYPYTGMVEETIRKIPHVDLFICSETIEHLDDPAWVLRDAYYQASYLLLSTPIECWHDDNWEHLWAWDQAGVEKLLTDAHWQITGFRTLDTRQDEEYLYGIWTAR